MMSLEVEVWSLISFIVGVILTLSYQKFYGKRRR
ncbi:hypothetical protein ES703_09515 [subsurface metagenome]